MTIEAINKIMTERIWVSRVASEIVFQPMFSYTGAPLHDERVITVRKERANEKTDTELIPLRKIADHQKS